MNLKNISFKKLLTQGGLALATLLSRLLEGCIALASMVYKLLRYALKALWAVFILALLIIPYGIFRLYQGYKNRKNAPKKEQEQIVYTGNIIFLISASIDFCDFYSLAQVKETEISDIFARDLCRLILSTSLPAGSKTTRAVCGKANAA